MPSNTFDKFIGRPALFILLALVVSHFISPPEPITETHSALPLLRTPPLGLSPPPPVPEISEWLLPLDTGNRMDWNTLVFEHDAHYKALRKSWNPRKPRLHTGVDLQNGGNWGALGGPGEPVYAMGPGWVFGIYGTMPNRRIIISHELPSGTKFWSCYLHISGIQVRPGQRVDANTVIARRLNSKELRKHGATYNHLHFEILRRLPPWQHRKYRWMSQYCFSRAQVDRYFYDPEDFFRNLWQNNGYVD